MKEKSFADIKNKIRRLKIEDHFDMVIGIASGGIVPAYMIARQFNLPLDYIWINFRDSSNNTSHDSPILLKPVSFEFKDKSILLVDDRVQTGQTINLAKSILNEAKLIKTLALNGNADIILFDEECFTAPWNI